MRIWWTSRNRPDVWFEEYLGECGHMYFPKAEWFMKNFPYIAVRVFWVCIKVRNLIRGERNGKHR
uniref:Uncharacterized protein n=1 Tax=viral metagenome TaxID=1070528 RepID=A0A6M3JJP8_9ZZZZ